MSERDLVVELREWSNGFGAYVGQSPIPVNADASTLLARAADQIELLTFERDAAAKHLDVMRAELCSDSRFSSEPNAAVARENRRLRARVESLEAIESAAFEWYYGDDDPKVDLEALMRERERLRVEGIRAARAKEPTK